MKPSDELNPESLEAFHKKLFGDDDNKTMMQVSEAIYNLPEDEQEEAIAGLKIIIGAKSDTEKRNRVRFENGKRKPFVRSSSKVGRNEPCPCGSGLKFKRCHDGN